MIKRFTTTALKKEIDSAMKLAAEHFQSGRLTDSIDANLKLFTIPISQSDMEKDRLWLKLGAARINTGQALQALGNSEASLEHLLYGIKILDCHYSECKREISMALDLATKSLISLERFDEAMELHQRSLSIKDMIYPSGSESIVMSLIDKAAIYRGKADQQNEEKTYFDALHAAFKLHSTTRPFHANVLLCLHHLVKSIGAKLILSAEEIALSSSILKVIKDSDLGEGAYGQVCLNYARSVLNLWNIAKLQGEENEACQTPDLHRTTLCLPSHSKLRAEILEKKFSDSKYQEALNLIDSIEPEEVEALEISLSADQPIRIEDLFPSSSSEALVQGEVFTLDLRGHVGHGHPLSRRF